MEAGKRGEDGGDMGGVVVEEDGIFGVGGAA